MRNLPDSGFGAARGGMNGIGSLVRSFSMFGMHLNRIAQQEKRRVHKAYQESSVGAPITQAASDARAEARRQSRWITDPALKRAVNNLAIDFNKAAKSADSLQKQERARVVLLQGLRNAERSATSAVDRTAIRDLRTHLDSSLATAFTTARAQKALGKDPTSGFKGFIGKLPSIVKGFQAGWTAFQQVNGHINQMARAAMQVSRERGHYGRQIRGAGLNFSDMMSAIGTGRRSGMDDSEVIQKMVGMQTQLAQARWGEGPMINNMGRWGLTPFTSEGKMKSPKQVMMDLSDKLNSISDETEKLQFLTHQGFAPEQMEFVANYSRDARRWEEMKKHPERMGVLESARMIDESGLSAKIDDATNLELRRRQILNQNAIDDGIWSGLKRQLHPENWYFNDWTARQKGVASAKGDVSADKLTAAFRDATKEIRKNTGAVTLNSKAFSKITDEDIANTSLWGGWAQRNIEQYGEKSHVKQMRNYVETALNLGSSEHRGQLQNFARAGGHALGGAALGAVTGAALGGLGVALGVLSGGAAIPAMMLTAALLGGGLGMAGASGTPPPDPVGSNKAMLKDLRAARTQEDLDRRQAKYGLSGLQLSTVTSPKFQTDDSYASEQVGNRLGLEMGLKMQAKTGVAYDPNLSFTDKYYWALKRRREREGRTLTEEDMINSMARAHTGGKVGLTDEFREAYYSEGLDFENDDEIRNKYTLEQGKIANEHKDWTIERVQEEAKKNVTKEVIQGLPLEERKWLAQKKESLRDKAVNEVAQAQNELKDDGERLVTRDGDKETDEFKKYSEMSLPELEKAYSKAQDEFKANTSLTSGTKVENVKRLLDARKRLDAADKASAAFSEILGLKGELPFELQDDAGKRKAVAQLKAENAKALEGKSAEEQLSYLAIKGKAKGMTREDIETYQVSAEEVKQKEEQRKKEEEREKAKGEKKKEQTELLTLQAIDASGATLTDAEKARMEELRNKSLFADEDLTDETKVNHQAIKSIIARGGDLSAFSAEDVKQVQEEEAKREKTFLAGGLGSEADWNVFKGLENKMLAGGELAADEAAHVKDIQGKIDAASKNEPEEVTNLWGEDEASPEAAAYLNSDRVESDEQVAKRLAKEGAKPSMALQSDLRQIDNMMKHGFTEEDIQQHFGADRLAEYKDAVVNGIYEDHAAKSKEERKAHAMAKRSERLKAAGFSEDSEAYQRIMGEAEQDWDNAEQRREEAKAKREEAKKAYNEKNGITETGYPTDETDIPMGHTFMATKMASEGTELAAATGQALMKGGAGGDVVNSNNQNTIEIHEGAVVISNTGTMDSEQVAGYVGDSLTKFCDAFTANNKGTPA